MRSRRSATARRSYWLRDAGRADVSRAAARAGERLDVDVAIVGGGFTGLWTAIALTDTDPSLRVAVLEAETRRVRGERPERRLLRGAA